jgi:hypothetical protein
MSCIRTLATVGTLSVCSIQVASAQGRSSTATIDVLGGAHAGKHTLASPPDVGCMISERPGKPKRFTVNYGIPTDDPRSSDPNALTFIAVVIRNANGAAPAATGDYEASVNFGPVMDTKRGVFYMSGSNATTGRKGGGGSVRLEDHGKDARVLLDLQPQPGIVVKGTVTCTNVLRY